MGDLRRREVAFTSLHEALDTTTPGGRLVFHVFAALAEFIRELIVSGTREGLATARERGRTGGRPVVATPEIIRAARDLLPNPENSITSIARLLRVSPGTLYNHIPDLRELRQAGTARPARRPGSARSGLPVVAGKLSAWAVATRCSPAGCSRTRTNTPHEEERQRTCSPRRHLRPCPTG